MVNLEGQIKGLQEKLQLLLKQMTLHQRENVRLTRELQKSQGMVAEKEQSLQTLKQQLDAMKLGSGGLDPLEKEALAKRIDLYLKEIDKCLTLLNT